MTVDLAELYWLAHSRDIPFRQIASAQVTQQAAALKAAWAQKWLVHRRLRPEAFGGRIHLTKTKTGSYPIHPDTSALAKSYPLVLI